MFTPASKAQNVEPGAHLSKHNIFVDCGVALELGLEATHFVDGNC
jgi:hypothetical protein